MKATKEKQLTLTLSSDTDIKALEALITSKGLEILVRSTNPKINGQPLAITASSVKVEQVYKPIIQGRGIQNLTTIRITDKQKQKQKLKNRLSTETEIIREAFTAKIPDAIDPRKLKPSTHMLIWATIQKLTDNGVHSPIVTFTVAEYMRMRGLKDRKSAVEDLISDLDIIRAIPSKLEKTVRKDGKTDPGYDWASAFDAASVKNGVVTISFSPNFFRYLASCNRMAGHRDLLKIDVKRHPNSFYLGAKMLYHKNLNRGKKSECILSVKSLLESAIYIPSYDEVMAGNRNVTKRIIDPFIRDMEALEGIFNWEFCHSKGAPLTEEELSIDSYALFSSLMVKFDTVDEYPKVTQKGKKPRRRQAKKDVGRQA